MRHPLNAEDEDYEMEETTNFEIHISLNVEQSEELKWNIDQKISLLFTGYIQYHCMSW